MEGFPPRPGINPDPSQERTVPWWQSILAVTGAGMGPLTLGFLGWAWWRSTRLSSDTDE